MASNNNKDKCNVPHLRFPEFSGEWKMATFGDIAKGFDYGMNAAAKSFDGNNKYIRITDIDEVSSQYLYDDVVSPDGELEDRYLVKENDILLARTGASTGKSYLYRNSDGKLYFAGFLIRANIYKHNSYFVFSQLHTLRYKKWISVMSARSGQPGINSQEYASFPVYTTSLQEEDKIATFLKLLDERIITQNKIIDKLQSLIKGIVYQAKIDGVRQNTWQKKELRKVLQERNEKNTKGYEVCSVSVTQGVVNQIEYLGRSFAAKDTLHYNVVKYGDIVYTKSPTGDFPYGIVKRSNIRYNVAVSPLYGVYEPVNDNIGIILHFYFMQPSNALNYLHRLIQKGAKNTISITNGRFLENTIPLPNSSEETKRLAWLLTAIQNKMVLELDLLSNYQKQKQYLLRQMFI
ncbi:restriction endonuclease subunit S [Bacteroides xylanisolvens]|uniref:Restriction endonuclease subunit S n=2 Tax=Bacteroides TaxID=816 RepID=A0AAW4SQF4_9BACE|nr:MULTISPECIES: restriction endonuclease subunit S [Bacteroides]MCA4467941.1 restriction endonuclease subunit S [Bacteroides xylanisolvens]MCA4525001.1 restriction endonuclease subunit S [Bacteroides xylanisolvens]MCB6735401.1 restriction endonuclease subunit S [Bacteroides xylanisolvens]MCB7122665.1 restriction endonuclease subunit S [Bacteroides xylanisolvens]